jgi:hypothetical protein
VVLARNFFLERVGHTWASAGALIRAYVLP